MGARLELRMLIIMLLVCVMAVAARPSLAQTGNGYDLTWSTIDGGGARRAAAAMRYGLWPANRMPAC